MSAEHRTTTNPLRQKAADVIEEAFDAGYAHARAEFDRRYARIAGERDDAACELRNLREAHRMLKEATFAQRYGSAPEARPSKVLVVLTPPALARALTVHLFSDEYRDADVVVAVGLDGESKVLKSGPQPPEVKVLWDR